MELEYRAKEIPAEMLPVVTDMVVGVVVVQLALQAEAVHQTHMEPAAMVWDQHYLDLLQVTPEVAVVVAQTEMRADTRMVAQADLAVVELEGITAQ